MGRFRASESSSQVRFLRAAKKGSHFELDLETTRPGLIFLVHHIGDILQPEHLFARLGGIDPGIVAAVGTEVFYGDLPIDLDIDLHTRALLAQGPATSPAIGLPFHLATEDAYISIRFLLTHFVAFSSSRSRMHVSNANAVPYGNIVLCH